MPTNTLALVDPPSSPPASGFNVNDFIFILYRHKIKILLFLLVGILAAGAVSFLLPAPYESQAKLLVRYVVDRSAVDGTVGGDGAKGESAPVGAPSESILNSEVEILTSSDLALQVAQAIGPARLIADKKKATVENAAIAIKKAMEVDVIKGSNIISVTYQNKDGALAVAVLDQIVHRYLEKHLEVHRSVGGYEFVSEEAGKLRVELTKTEDELKRLKEKYNVTSVAETIAATGAELTKTQGDLDTTMTDLATQKAHVAEIDKFFHGADIASSSEKAEKNVAPVTPDNETVNKYQGLVERVEALRKTNADLLARYSAGSRMVKSKQDALDSLEKQKVSLEKKWPALITTVATGGSSSSASSAAASTNDIILERARLAGLEAHLTELQSRIPMLQQRLRVLNDVAPRITELERIKDVQEASFRYYGSSLEKARVDQGLNPSRMPNINVVQNPSPAMRSLKDSKKVVIGLVGGGLVMGLALAMAIEFVFDRTIKRARELEMRLRLPLMLTIPDFGGRLRLMESSDSQGGDSLVETSGEYLRPFCEAIRDRLGLFFEMNNMAHKPKLVAVTGLSKNAGVSTLAGGLAEVLSEGVEGKVILVDKPVSPKRFYSLMAEFKMSELDYVVFDMPSLGDTSSTLPMAGFMDKVLLVVEAEKSGRDSVKRAYEQLSAKTDVSVIFNKSRVYGPKWLEGEV
jgi:uncharacterized protein involved in exopolysaccharide biosynthesis